MADFTLDHPRGSASGDFGGLVPVQGHGSVTRDGVTHRWDFRARHTGWTLAIGPEHAEIKGYVHDGDAVWGAGGEWGEWPEAGYMPDATVTAILRDTLTRYLDGEVSWEAPGDLHMVEAPNG